MLQSARLKAILEREIIIGEIKPGQHLDETELANRYGVSRTPVREALMILESINLIERRPRQGAIVKGVTLTRLVQLMEALCELESICGRLTAQRAGPKEIAALETAFKEYKVALGSDDRDQVYDKVIKFHRTLFTTSGNDELAEITEQIAERMEPFLRAQHHSEHWSDTRFCAAHEKTMAAIRAGDGEETARLLRQIVQIDTGILVEFTASREG